MGANESKPLDVCLHVHIELASEETVNVNLGSFLLTGFGEGHLEVWGRDRGVELGGEAGGVEDHLVGAEVVDFDF